MTDQQIDDAIEAEMGKGYWTFGVGAKSQDELRRVGRAVLRAAIASAESAPAAAPESAQAVGHARIDSGELHFVPNVRDAEVAGINDGQLLYTHPSPARVAVALTPEKCQQILDDADFLVTGENLRRHDYMLYRSVGEHCNVTSYHMLELIALAWRLGANQLTAPEGSR